MPKISICEKQKFKNSKIKKSKIEISKIKNQKSKFQKSKIQKSKNTKKFPYMEILKEIHVTQISLNGNFGLHDSYPVSRNGNQLL